MAIIYLLASDAITPTLRDTIHWLPISQRITFEVALMMFDCSRGRCPKYFGDVYISVHIAAARSTDHGDLVVPRVRLTRFWQPQLLRVWSDNLEQTSTGFAKHRDQGTV